MKNKVLIFHGSGGSPEGNWFPWLKEQLEKENCEVIVPRFPTPENQTLENWFEVYNEIENIDENTIVVAHSLGVAFTLNVLHKRKLKAAFFVAGVSGDTNNAHTPIMTTFVENGFDWHIIKQNCKEFRVYYSDNDPYLPLEHGEEQAKNLGVDLTVIKGAGHINSESGYTTLPILLEDIKKLLAKDL